MANINALRVAFCSPDFARELERENTRQAEEIARLKADKERLDWLDNECSSVYPVAAVVVKVGHGRNSSKWANCTGTAREAIDRAIALTPTTPQRVTGS